MRLLTIYSVVTAVVVASASDALALPSEDAKPSAPATEATAPAADAEEQTTAANAEPTFKIRRGFFAEADLGIFVTFAGYNTNRTDLERLPSVGMSNPQPHVGIVVGYDVYSTPDLNIALGLRLAMASSSGSGRITAEEAAVPLGAGSKKVSDYAVLETGLQAGAAFFVTERVAISAKIDGGPAMIYPDTNAAAKPKDENAGKAAFGLMFGAGAGIEYFTMLNDFSVGLDLRFVGVLPKGGLIPGASATIPIRYTF